MNSTLQNFIDFVGSEVKAEVLELAKLKTDANRIHLQKLVYVNLINRFDVLIDNLLLENSVNNADFKQKVLKEVKEEPVYLKDLYELLTASDLQSAAARKIKNIARAKFLGDRHSKKIDTLLRHCLNWENTELDRPRVNIATGSILEGMQQQKKIPNTVIGYADWLYSRRNSMVHGDDQRKIQSGDLQYMKKRFHVLPSEGINLKLSSIKSASEFYLSLCRRMGASDQKKS